MQGLVIATASSVMTSSGQSVAYADAINQLVDNGTQEALGSAFGTVLSCLEPKSGDRILNLGSDSGFFALQLARHSGANIDSLCDEQDGVERARLVCRELGITRVRFHRSEGIQVAFLAESFDKVLVEPGFCRLAANSGFLQEMNRIMVSGALLGVISDQDGASALEDAQHLSATGFELADRQCLGTKYNGELFLVRKVRRHSYHAWDR